MRKASSPDRRGRAATRTRHGVVGQHRQIVRVELGLPIRRHEVRVDDALEVPLRHERCRRDEVQRDEGHESDHSHDVAQLLGAIARQEDRERREDAAIAPIETATYRRSPSTRTRSGRAGRRTADASTTRVSATRRSPPARRPAVAG